MAWEDRSMTMDQFRNIDRTALERARHYCSRLMYGWEPPCYLSEVKDILSNTTYGYSFVSDPANGLSDAYLELSKLACLTTTGALMTDDDWDRHAVRQYLDLYDELQRLVMLLICFYGGQWPRGTDILAVAHRNSADNRRGVCIYSGSIAIINQVNKARRATNKEFYVVRFLDNEISRIVYWCLVYVRPVCCMLQRACLA